MDPVALIVALTGLVSAITGMVAAVAALRSGRNRASDPDTRSSSA